MSFTGYSFKNPYLIITLSLFLFAGGLYAFFQTPTDLFPDTMPPTAVILTTWRGASAESVSDNITQVIETQLRTVSGINNIVSTTKDEVSSIKIDFYYHKNLQEVTAETVNILNRIKPSLPQDATEPQIFQITAYTKPIVTLALSPKAHSRRSLNDIRLLAENQIRDYLFAIKGVADVEIFGGNRPSINIIVQKDNIARYNLSISDVIAELLSRNITIPAGIIESSENEYTLKSDSAFSSIAEIKNTIISARLSPFIHLSDIADIEYASSQDRSIYHGNAMPAIALNILKTPEIPTVKLINEVKDHIIRLQEIYSDIKFDITTDQQPLIDVNIKGMTISLLSAVILTIIIIFLFLGRLKTSFITGISIPLSFLSAFIYLYLSPYTLNMVTLSALIIAVGMVVDASVVILENIIRLYEKEKLTILKASIKGADEISFAVFAGMMTTVIVLLPVMFTGGYPQTVLKPLGTTVMITLLFSWLMAVTLVPLLINKLIKPADAPKLIERKTKNIYLKAEEKIKSFYMSLLDIALKNKIKTIALTAVCTAFIVVVSMKTVGRSVLPPMDTGIANISFEIAPNSNLKEMQSIINRVEKEILKEESVISISTIAGSEPGTMSFSQGGSSVQTASMEVNLLPRNKRARDIWTITDEWRERLSRYPELVSMTLTEYGATPTASTKSPVNIIISGEDNDQLSYYANTIISEISSIKGLVDIKRTWYNTKEEYQIKPKPLMLELYNHKFSDIAGFIRSNTSEIPVGNMRLENYNDIPVIVKLDNFQSIDTILDLRLPDGIPLRSLITVEKKYTKTLDTRQDLKNTIDILAVNRIVPVSIITDRVIKKIEPIIKSLPSDIEIAISGTVEEMGDTMGRVFSSLLIGLVLLYFLLVIMLKSFKYPIAIMSVIPFSLSGAFLGLLIFNKSVSMPAMMGIILLNGTIVNNAILIVSFINDARKKGIELIPAVRQSVDLRLRPILMTTLSTVIGLSPLVFETAVGLERMSPLGIVAASGLIAGTFLTMVIVPVVYVLLEKRPESGAKTFCEPFVITN